MKDYMVVADIHGQKHLLDMAIKTAQDRGITKIIFLGDYIDRGPDSKGVVFGVMNPPEGMNFICLTGNHEQMLLDAYHFADYRNSLCDYYNTTGQELRTMVEWIAKLPAFHVEGKNWFAHAWMDDSLENQSMAVNVWKRVPTGAYFSRADVFFTHGHTPHDFLKRDFAENRLNLDIGGMRGRELLVAIFDDETFGPKELIHLVV